MTLFYCIHCTFINKDLLIDNVKLTTPQIALLPKTKITGIEHPFFYTGVYYFGLIEVIFGRRQEKKWVVLLTCSATCPIHLEVANSL